MLYNQAGKDAAVENVPADTDRTVVDVGRLVAEADDGTD